MQVLEAASPVAEEEVVVQAQVVPPESLQSKAEV